MIRIRSLRELTRAATVSERRTHVIVPRRNRHQPVSRPSSARSEMIKLLCLVVRFRCDVDAELHENILIHTR